jgi:hypothetical protein
MIFYGIVNEWGKLGNIDFNAWFCVEKLLGKKDDDTNGRCRVCQWKRQKPTYTLTCQTSVDSLGKSILLFQKPDPLEPDESKDHCMRAHNNCSSTPSMTNKNEINSSTNLSLGSRILISSDIIPTLRQIKRHQTQLFSYMLKKSKFTLSCYNAKKRELEK